MHLGVPGTGRVLRRGRCGDDRGVHDAAPAHDPALLIEDLVLGLEEFLAELVLLQEVAKVQQRGGIRDLLDCEVKPHEPPHRIRVVDRVFDALIGQREPHLQQVHPQHRLNRFGLAALLARPVGVVVGLDQPDPPGPRDRGVHRDQELFATRDPAPVAVLDVSEAGLLVVHTLIISRSGPTRHTPPRPTEKISASLDTPVACRRRSRLWPRLARLLSRVSGRAGPRLRRDRCRSPTPHPPSAASSVTGPARRSRGWCWPIRARRSGTRRGRSSTGGPLSQEPSAPRRISIVQTGCS